MKQKIELTRPQFYKQMENWWGICYSTAVLICKTQFVENMFKKTYKLVDSNFKLLWRLQKIHIENFNNYLMNYTWWKSLRKFDGLLPDIETVRLASLSHFDMPTMNSASSMRLFSEVSKSSITWLTAPCFSKPISSNWTPTRNACNSSRDICLSSSESIAWNNLWKEYNELIFRNETTDIFYAIEEIT